MAWQSGLTGIGWNTEKVSQPLTKMDDLMNPDIVGTNSVGMLKADMPDLVMINLGIDPGRLRARRSGRRPPTGSRC